MLARIKEAGMWILGAIGTLVLIIFGLKLKKLDTLEKQEKARSLEEEVKDLRESIQKHQEDVHKKEKALREKIAAFKHEQRQLQDRGKNESPTPDDVA